MKLNLAVAGMGHWGKNLVRNFYDSGVLKVVCDEVASHRDVVEEKYPGVDFTTDFSSIMDDPSIEAVVIATPAATHFRLAKKALTSGKDVFVEKPLSLDVKDAEELISIADANDRILMVGHILHYHPAIITIKHLIKNKELGDIRYMYSNRVSMGKIRTEENVLWSFASHDISVILGLLDEEPEQVSCEGSSFIGSDIVDMAMSQLLFASGVRAHIFVSWLHPFKEQRLVVVGSEKMIVFDDVSDDKLKIYDHRIEYIDGIPTAIKGDAESIPLPASEPLRSECEHFIHCVQLRQEPMTNGREGLRVLKVLNKCQQELDKRVK